jgi:RNA polymerase sigma-70 factor, ECF subfamily
MLSGSKPPVVVDSSEPADADIVRQVLGGDTAVFERLMRRYNERVYRVARAIVRDEEEAEDVMQQAYVNAFAHLGRFNGTAPFSTWLTKIVIDESFARVRRRSP